MIDESVPVSELVIFILVIGISVILHIGAPLQKMHQINFIMFSLSKL